MNCCDSNSQEDTISFLVTNTGDEDKTFRLFGGGTGLDTVDDNTIPGFDYGTGFDSDVYSIAVQSDGKIIVGGVFTSYNGTLVNGIIRLNTDGSIDSTFVYGTGFVGIVSIIVIQSDGKIVVGGTFTSYDGTPANGIIRLDSDGSVDGTFVYGTGFVGSSSIIAIQSDGKIIVGGSFTSYDGTPASGIIRLDSDGSVDGTFVYGTGFDFGVNAITIQSDGKIIAGGNFTSYDATSANGIIRLDSNGSIDGSFIYGTGFIGTVLIANIQSDGKIIVGGNFTSYDGTSANRIIRLESNGSIDGTFAYGTGFNNTTYTFIIQSDGKIIVGGAFSSYNGTSANGIIRLDSNGSVDGTFDYGTGFNSFVYILTVQSDGEIIIGGGFTEYNTTAAGFIVVLNSNGSVNLSTEAVEIVVNGGNTTIAEVNNDTLVKPICICALDLIASEKSVFNNLLNKDYKSSSGDVQHDQISLLARFTAFNNQNVVNLTGDDFTSCVLDGDNYFQWVVPANSNVSINVSYCQYDRSPKMPFEIKEKPKKKKKYIHGRFKYLLN